MVRVRIILFGALARAAGERNVELDALTLKEAIDKLIEKYGEEFENRIYEAKGKVRRFINIYVNGRDIRFLNNLETQLNEDDIISIIPAVGGG